LTVGAAVHLNPLDLARVGAVAGREVKVIGVKGTIVLAVRPDPTVLRGTAWVPFDQPGANIGDLIDCTAPIVDVRIETL
jgi:formylmethanofuran dehydrogenase subunit D